MAIYNIFMLGEDDLTIAGGQLDGVNQGDGSHLENLTITLNSGTWQPVSISDNDNSFGDNDTSQTLNGPQTINNVAYASGTIVEAEYSFEVTDGTNTWTLIGFNVRDSPTSYATVEGVAFLDAPQGPPPVGVPLTITDTFEGPNYLVTEYDSPVCYVTGTCIDTVNGPTPIERITAGTVVQTRDHGLQEVLWTGHRRCVGVNQFAPVQFAPGSIGNTEPLLVSQQHKVLVNDWRAEAYFGQPQVLVPAKHLVGQAGISLVDRGPMGYHHLLFKDHVVVRSCGIWSESFQIGDVALNQLLPLAQQEIATQFPELIGLQSEYHSLRKHEARLLHHAA